MRSKRCSKVVHAQVSRRRSRDRPHSRERCAGVKTQARERAARGPAIAVATPGCQDFRLIARVDPLMSAAGIAASALSPRPKASCRGVAPVAELVDAPDLKSGNRKVVLVRFRPGAPNSLSQIFALLFADILRRSRNFRGLRVSAQSLRAQCRLPGDLRDKGDRNDRDCDQKQRDRRPDRFRSTVIRRFFVAGHERSRRNNSIFASATRCGNVRLSRGLLARHAAATPADRNGRCHSPPARR